MITDKRVVTVIHKRGCKRLLEKYRTVLLADEKGRLTIPAKVREQLTSSSGKVVFNFMYDSVENKIELIPIGESELKE